jgi:hypothetical protein
MGNAFVVDRHVGGAAAPEDDRRPRRFELANTNALWTAGLFDVQVKQSVSLRRFGVRSCGGTKRVACALAALWLRDDVDYCAAFELSTQPAGRSTSMHQVRDRAGCVRPRVQTVD